MFCVLVVLFDLESRRKRRLGVQTSEVISVLLSEPCPHSPGKIPKIGVVVEPSFDKMKLFPLTLKSP